MNPYNPNTAMTEIEHSPLKSIAVSLLRYVISLMATAFLIIKHFAFMLATLVINILKAMNLWDALTDLITRHRAPFVIVFVLPMSLCFDWYMALRSKIIMNLYSAPELHESRVLDVQQQVKQAVKLAQCRQGPSRLCTARPGWESISLAYRSYKQSSAQIGIVMYDILGDVELSEDGKTGTIWVEPMVSMGQISHFLNPKGWTLPVLPEMDDLTVGGLLMGVGIETSCHKYGLFCEMVEEYELIVGNGDRLVVRRDNEYADLFYALPWSYGTLGFLVSVKLAVIPCKPWVRVRYYPARTLKDAVAKFRNLSEGEAAPDFVEALSYSQETMVVMAGDMVDECEAKSNMRNEIGKFYKPWFYKHVQEFLDSGVDFAEEYIPIRDYYHRHTRSIFWELEYIIPIGNHPLFRYLLGWLVPPKVSFLKLTQTEGMKQTYENMHVAQDMLLPMKDLEQHIQVFDEYLGVYPLWLCPHKHYHLENRSFLRDPPHPDKQDRLGKYQMYVDIGAYGFPRDVLAKRPFDIIHTMRKLENYVYENHGFQMMYADTYQTKTEFVQMFNHEHYRQMRTKYHADQAFGEVYDKMALKYKQ